jgi:DNA repair protein RadC
MPTCWTATDRPVSSPTGGSLEACTRIADLPSDERPRERLARQGAGALSNRELVALLLGSGTRGQSALALAEGLVSDGLRGLAAQSLTGLEGRHGLGRAKATRLLAALELGARLVGEPQESAPAFHTAEDVARHLLARYAARATETFGVLALDARHRLRHETTISIGSLTSSIVHPREVFREAIAARAAALIVFHNHPSGDPEPSDEDIALTRRLASAGGVMGIELLDHIILGAGRFVSLKQRGIL